MEIGHRCCVGIHTTAAGDDLAIERTLINAGQQRRDTRLQHAVSIRDPLFVVGQQRTVQGMRRDADQIPDAAHGQTCVGIHLST